ncbi:hypothetical protein COLO4_12184 [Corchorus olitorius]|uniref:Uncharacterized protein n=1 Tax=Corchorus olitorius TaxID=93759 RepID=A0A1R3K1W3_9ROSI|nr:hypothetical protein COLO4_12184 [Corchorus olitorius]
MESLVFIKASAKLRMVVDDVRLTGIWGARWLFLLTFMCS